VRCGDDLVAQAPVDRGWARSCNHLDNCFELEIIVAPDCIGGLEFNVRKFEIAEFREDVDLEIVNVSSGRTLARALVGGAGGLSVRRIVGAGSLRDTLRVRGTDSLKAVVYSPAGCEGNDCYTQATGTRRVEECGR